MVEHVLNGRLPDEATVSRYFQLSSNEARARLRGVTSKYQRGLEKQIRQSIVDILNNAEHDNDTDFYGITVNNQTVIDLLNSALASIDGTLTAVSKVRGTVASFNMHRRCWVTFCKLVSAN
jgi:ribosomal protein L35AE/L33A